MTSTPPGWYDDGRGAKRWWDGATWTDQVQPGAIEAATAPAPPGGTSKRWILWGVIGVVVLGLVVTAIVVIPMLIGGLVSGQGGVDTSDPDERAALAAVDLWDQAWDEVDCDKFFRATTEDFRTETSLTDCAAFETQAQTFSETTDNYAVEVNSIERDNDVITVSTTETYDSIIDEQGQPLETPEAVVEQWQYYVIAVEGGWAIDDAGTQQQ